MAGAVGAARSLAAWMQRRVADAALSETAMVSGPCEHQRTGRSWRLAKTTTSLAHQEEGLEEADESAPREHGG